MPAPRHVIENPLSGERITITERPHVTGDALAWELVLAPGGGALGHPVRSLSGGTRRKLEIVRALVHQPRVLFLDEPTTGLDPESRRSLWSHLRETRASCGTTIVLTTHYLEEAEEADAVCVLARGRVIERGTPARIKARHDSRTLEDAYLKLLRNPG